MITKKVILVSISIIGLCFLTIQKTYANCSCGTASRTYFSPSHPPHSITQYHHYKTRKPKEPFNIIWNHIDPETSQSYILVKYIKPTGNGAYMTAPHYTFTKKHTNRPRHFTNAWAFQDKNDPTKLHPVYVIRKDSWKKPKSKDQHTYKWVNINDIRLHPNVLDNNFMGINVDVKDGSRVWIDQTLARALVKKIHKPVI